MPTARVSQGLLSDLDQTHQAEEAPAVIDTRKTTRPIKRRNWPRVKGDTGRCPPGKHGHHRRVSAEHAPQTPSAYPAYTERKASRTAIPRDDFVSSIAITGWCRPTTDPNPVETGAGPSSVRASRDSWNHGRALWASAVSYLVSDKGRRVKLYFKSGEILAVSARGGAASEECSAGAEQAVGRDMYSMCQRD